jgi:hypothetical protein
MKDKKTTVFLLSALLAAVLLLEFLVLVAWANRWSQVGRINLPARQTTRSARQPGRAAPAISPTPAGEGSNRAKHVVETAPADSQPASTPAVSGIISPGEESELKPIPARELNTSQQSSFAPTAQPVDFFADSPDLWGINFAPGAETITIKIFPKDKQVHYGLPIVIKFLPGSDCVFGDHYGCVQSYNPTSQGKVTFVSVHSGVGGEGQSLRGALEGTWINSAGYGLEHVAQNMAALSGARVSIRQGQTVLEGLQIGVVSRVPPATLGAYFSAPVWQALDIAAQTNPVVANFSSPDQPELVIETCGWRMRGEAWAQGIKATTGSAYLAVIQKATDLP